MVDPHASSSPAQCDLLVLMGIYHFILGAAAMQHCWLEIRIAGMRSY